jgi:uncharacterized membrane protein YeaQ/YmgE (transglycosylase-associated protein family)
MPHIYSPHSLLVLLIVGVVAGWLAGQLTRGNGFGLVNNLIIGVLGAVIGNFLFSLLGIYAFGIPAMIISASIGAVVLLFFLGQLKR